MTDIHDHEGFASRVRSALIWRSGSQILAQIITWASTFIVINLLDPADYGLFALTRLRIARERPLPQLQHQLGQRPGELRTARPHCPPQRGGIDREPTAPGYASV